MPLIGNNGKCEIQSASVGLLLEILEATYKQNLRNNGEIISVQVLWKFLCFERLRRVAWNAEKENVCPPVPYFFYKFLSSDSGRIAPGGTDC